MLEAAISLVSSVKEEPSEMLCGTLQFHLVVWQALEVSLASGAGSEAVLGT